MESIFISYRRSIGRHLARLVFQELRAREYDVFLDVQTIDSGSFDRIILNQISARQHFLIILSPGSLERCSEPEDWLRREIEEAFRLERNIVPIFDEDFDIENEKTYLGEPLRSDLPRLNAIPYYHFYFEAFFDILCNRFLKPPEYKVEVFPTPDDEKKEVESRIRLAEETIYKSEKSKINYVIDFELVEGTRGDIERLAAQINGSYEHGWYDACVVMLRRLLETLLIEVYETHQTSNAQPRFRSLAELIRYASSENTWNISASTMEAMPKLLVIGNQSAHARGFHANRNDIENLIPEIRIVVQELLYLANLK